jgi:MerR family transcriptional regulator, heat shock protein HspR
MARPDPRGKKGGGAEAHREDDERAVYIISVAAELAGVHPQTLRIYERKGLLRPARTAGNTRRYSNRDIERLRGIQRLTQVEGLNLAGVRMIVEMEDEIEQMRQRVTALDAELQQARRRLRDEIDRMRRETRRAEIVPRSSVPRLRVTVRSQPETGSPIPLGPAD